MMSGKARRSGLGAGSRSRRTSWRCHTRPAAHAPKHRAIRARCAARHPIHTATWRALAAVPAGGSGVSGCGGVSGGAAS